MYMIYIEAAYILPVSIFDVFRRERRAVWQSRKTEQEDSPELLEAKCEQLAQVWMLLSWFLERGELIVNICQLKLWFIITILATCNWFITNSCVVLFLLVSACRLFMMLNSWLCTLGQAFQLLPPYQTIEALMVFGQCCRKG